MTRRHNSARVEDNPVSRLAFALHELVKRVEGVCHRIRFRWLWPVCCGGRPRSWRYEGER